MGKQTLRGRKYPERESVPYAQTICQHGPSWTDPYSTPPGILPRAAILAVRQLSDTLQHRYRYQILSHLGFSEKRTDRYLRHQLFVYFGVPLLLPLPLSVFTSLCLHDLMRPYVADTQVFLYACLSIGIFLLIYSIYLAATYIGCRKNIQEGWHPLD